MEGGSCGLEVVEAVGARARQGGGTEVCMGFCWARQRHRVRRVVWLQLSAVVARSKKVQGVVGVVLQAVSGEGNGREGEEEVASCKPRGATEFAWWRLSGESSGESRSRLSSEGRRRGVGRHGVGGENEKEKKREVGGVSAAQEGGRAWWRLGLCRRSGKRGDGVVEGAGGRSGCARRQPREREARVRLGEDRGG